MRNDCDLLPQMLEFELPDVEAVDFDGSLFDFDDSTYGEADGTFSSTSSSNDSDFVAALDVEV